MDTNGQRFLPLYYLGATPLFFLLDAGWEVSLRATFLDDPGARLAYYGFCVACGALVWLRPRHAAWVGLGESTVTITLLIVGFMSPLLNLPGELLENPSAEIPAPFTGESIVNFAIAAGVAWWSFQRAVRQLGNRRPHSTGQRP